MTKAVVSQGSRVSLHFSIELESGELVDSTRDRSPATFEYGDGNLLPGFEQALLGLAEGESRLSRALECVTPIICNATRCPTLRIWSWSLV